VVAWADIRRAFEARLKRSVGDLEPPRIEPPPAGEDLAIVLDGGGARAAYQVGLLRGLVRRHPTVRLPMITGVSAGAINAAYLAAHPGPLVKAVDDLSRLWANLTVEQVFRVDTPSLASNVWHWGLGLVSGGRIVRPPLRGMVDTAPLRERLESAFGTAGTEAIAGISRNLEAGHLKGLAIITSSYTTGRTVAWVQGRNIADWERPYRMSRQCRITVDHVMASAALPLFFPAVSLDGNWYGDGGIRLITPLSPAVHLGARRILAFSTRYGRKREEAERPQVLGYPAPAQIGGQLLNAIFLDDLDRDALNLVRLNLLLEDLPEEKRRGLRVIDLVFIRPSQDIGRMAGEYEARLPRLLRHMLGGTGSRQSNSDLLSLVMFQPDYLKRMLDLGEADFEARAEDVDALLAGRETP
jgi:NTE family protein